MNEQRLHSNESNHKYGMMQNDIKELKVTIYTNNVHFPMAQS